MSEKSIWEQAGMNRIDYSKLPWPEMRKLIIRYRGLNIQDSCFGCGRGERQIVTEQQEKNMPENLKGYPYRHLLSAYLKDEAEKDDLKKRGLL